MGNETGPRWWRRVPGEVWFGLALLTIYVVGVTLIVIRGGAQ